MQRIKEVRKLRLNRATEAAAEVKPLSVPWSGMMELAQEKGASSWLTCLPMGLLCTRELFKTPRPLDTTGSLSSPHRHVGVEQPSQ